MTTQHPSIRRLHRRTDDRVLAGVASGLGDYFNADPLLIRILLVASIVFGGLGIFLYVAAWLLVPDDRSSQSIAERTLGAVSLPGGFLGGVLAVIGALILLGIVGTIVGDGGAGLALAFIVVAVGALLLRRPETGAVPLSSEAAGDVAATGDTAQMPQPSPAVAHAADTAPRARRVRLPPSPLGWYVAGTALVGVGLLAAARSAGVLFPEPGHYFGLAVLVIGAGLLVGARWGHARALILVGLLLLPFAWVASLVDMPLEGGWGSRQFAPTTSAELREEYRLAGGELVLDLTGYGGADASVVVDASIGFGDLRVLLPEQASAEIVAGVGGGMIQLPDGPRLEGTGLEDRRVIDGDGTTFNLFLDAGIGAVRVDRIATEER